MRSVRSSALVGILGSVLTVVGCNALSGLDADYEVVGNSVTEAGSPGEGGGGNASFDAGERDGSSGVVPVGCPSGALFCDDFEDTAKASSPFGWTRSETNGGEPRLETGAGFGSSRALRAQVSPDGFSGKVALWRVVDTTFPASRRMVLSFQFKLAEAGIDYSVLGAIQLNGSEYGLAVYQNARCPSPPAACLDENQPSGQHVFTGAIPLALGVWHRADVAVVRTATAYEGKVTVDGTTVVHDGITSLQPGEPTRVEVGVGAFFTGPAGSTDAVVDNVVVRYE